ncbi:MAG: NAD+ synthase [Nitrospirae bacterium]|nr:NAD+ synthase [Nitrospirota bacterium]
MQSLRVGMAQINATVGDLSGNTQKILDYIDRAGDLGVDIVCFPELSLTGYPPEDLLFKPRFVAENLTALRKIAGKTRRLTAVVGFIDKKEDIYNGAAVISHGEILGIYHKIYLPNYGVFDEKRYFQRGGSCQVYELYGAVIGVNICEDIWYPEGPCMSQAMAGAQVILNINSSPYHVGKWRFRERMLATRASDNGVFLAYTNLVGGQDELLFDGHSMLFRPDGEVMSRGKTFEEDLIVADLDFMAVERARQRDPRGRGKLLSGESLREGGLPVLRIHSPVPRTTKKKPVLQPRSVRPLDPVEEIYRGLVTGVRDYVGKNGFREVVVGLSGGVDSALTVGIAVDALGKEQVNGVFLPSMYTSRESVEDVQHLVKRLGIRLLTLPITELYENYLRTLSKPFSGYKADATEENLQARVRGNVMMALSNKFGWLVLTTGNKSEMSVGYATLYGDMAGGFAVIKDVLKTRVYELAHYRNSWKGGPLIPERILTKEPTAELRPGQKDSDSLPPYPILDPILQAYVEEDRSYEEIVAMGYEERTVKRVISLVDHSEYKRRQSPPGIKITPRAFGKDWRVPITNRYKGF